MHQPEVELLDPKKFQRFSEPCVAPEIRIVEHLFVRRMIDRPFPSLKIQADRIFAISLFCGLSFSGILICAIPHLRDFSFLRFLMFGSSPFQDLSFL